MEDDGGLEMADDYVNAGKRDGIDIDELYELTKKDKWFFNLLNNRI